MIDPGGAAVIAIGAAIISRRHFGYELVVLPAITEAVAA